MSQRTSAEGGGLSAQTLVIAAIASGLAAVVVSQVWEQGTVFSAALTPVIVALVSEFLKRPTEHVSRRVTSRRTRTQRGERSRVPLPSEPDYEPPVPGGGGERELPPGVSVYRGSRGPRPIHVGVALATGLIAFAIAATVLTVPELLFGKSVDGKRDTTFFGGRDRDRSDEETPTVTAPQQTQTAPEAETTPEEEPPPTTTTPPGSQTQPPAQPPGTEQPPGGGTPAPPQSPPPAQ